MDGIFISSYAKNINWTENIYESDEIIALNIGQIVRSCEMLKKKC